MSTQPTSGPGLNVTDIDESYDVSTSDDVVSLLADWAGGTVTLPGPATGNDAPNNGDKYQIIDPTNAIVRSGHDLTVNGGGYEFLSGGGLVTQTTFDSLVSVGGTNGAIQKACISFTFDAEQQIWMVC